VHNPSPYSADGLKAFKSTDALQYAVTGWVNDVKLRHLATKDLYLIMGNIGNNNDNEKNKKSNVGFWWYSLL